MNPNVLLAVIAIGIFLAQTVPAASEPPNIILIIADDVGREDIGAYGNKGVRTPNLDRMAQDGMTFTDAFDTCSSCSPSRCSIITSRYPHNTGAERLHMPLPADQVTFVEKLKAAGYWTAQAGKWHMGDAIKDRFDDVREDKLAKTGIQKDGSGCELWQLMLEERPKDKPFFLWLASHDAHRPYAENTLAVPHKPEDVWVPPYLPDVPETRKDLAMYYDEIGRLDSYIGKLMEDLKSRGLLDNTVIFFVSDNGRPFPRCKTTVYDSGVRTPLLAQWPGHIAPGSVCKSLVSTIDLGPTILQLAGLSPTQPTFQGQSIVPLLEDPKKTVRDKLFAEHNWHDFAACERSVRTKQFHYIRNYWPDLPGNPPADAMRGLTWQEMLKLRDAGKLTPEQMTCFLAPRPEEELYDIEVDPQQLHNLAGNPEYAAVLKGLRQQLEAWRNETQDSVPSPRPPDGFDRETGKSLKKGKKKPPEEG